MEYKNKKPNRLISEKSPYLLQHAYNPVDWFPWGDEAFRLAKEKNKPVFLSIGYSTCHWCHVMEKECFEDSEVAKLMNENFVSIKVDREERPDLDSVYMTVCQVMGRRCGWPLTIIMTPDKNPFFAASYIPKNDRFGMSGMMSLIPQIAQIWKTRQQELENTGVNIKSRLKIFSERTSQGKIEKDILNEAFEKLSGEYDENYGGFGGAPKFPTPHKLLFLLRFWKRTGNQRALSMVQKTLREMRLGGLFDQVGNGFHRYSTDNRWLVPHFEKMLYDQALLTLAYTEAYEATKAGKFMITAKEVLEYVMRDLADKEGGFFSAEDADSEGEEGKYYVWTEEQIREAVEDEDQELAIKIFGVTKEGNFMEGRMGRPDGRNILHFPKPLDKVASDFGLTLDELISKLGGIQRQLFEAKKNRIRPSRDEKVLTDWNGLMIAALARAGFVFNEKLYLQAARRAADFILTKMIKDKTLYHRYAKGETAIEGFLDDYAFLVFGLIELYEATFEERFLKTAADLNEKMIDDFWDQKNGGFYFTSESNIEGIPRMKQIYDGAVPSGNSVALLNLLRLSRLADNTEYENLADKLATAFGETIKDLPQAHTFELVGLDFAFGPSYSIILVDDPHGREKSDLLSALRINYLPNVTVLFKPPDPNGLGYQRINQKQTAYVCIDQTCLPPTNDSQKMLKMLEKGKEED